MEWLFVCTKANYGSGLRESSCDVPMQMKVFRLNEYENCGLSYLSNISIWLNSIHKLYRVLILTSLSFFNSSSAVD